jgi:hypothetical protein
MVIVVVEVDVDVVVTDDADAAPMLPSRRRFLPEPDGASPSSLASLFGGLGDLGVLGACKAGGRGIDASPAPRLAARRE